MEMRHTAEQTARELCDAALPLGSTSVRLGGYVVAAAVHRNELYTIELINGSHAPSQVRSR